jgi:hypothetical protein
MGTLVLKPARASALKKLPLLDSFSVFKNLNISKKVAHATEMHYAKLARMCQQTQTRRGQVTFLEHQRKQCFASAPQFPEALHSHPLRKPQMQRLQAQQFRAPPASPPRVSQP